jgi:hypothetical protein
MRPLRAGDELSVALQLRRIHSIDAKADVTVACTLAKAADVES